MKTKLTVYMIIFFLLSGFIISPAKTTNALKAASSVNSSTDYKQILDDADKIVIRAKVITLNKQYIVYVKGKEVARVKGRFITALGDKFVLTDSAGNFLIQERQIKRWGVKFTRMAEISDEEGNVLGYIGEKVSTNIFSIGHTFHFFDKDKNEIGLSDTVDLSLTKENKFYNPDNKVGYKVKKALISIGNEYTLTVLDKSSIPLYDAILMVCIEDSITSAEKKKSK